VGAAKPHLGAAALALVVILLYLRMETRPIYGGISVGLLLGGSLGNLYERVVRGEVTDYVSFWFWRRFKPGRRVHRRWVLLVAVGLLWGIRRGMETASGPEAGPAGPGPDAVESSLIVDPHSAGERLDALVGRMQGVGSRAQAAQLIDQGRVTVDGRTRAKSFRPPAGS